MHRTPISRPLSPWRLRSSALALLLPVLSAGCDTESLLKVEAPSQLPAENLESPTNAALLVNGAVSDWECAVGAFVVTQGVMSDELADSQLGAAAWSYDRRDFNVQPGGAYGTFGCDNSQTPGVYRPLSTARWSADNALTYLQEWTDAQVPNRTALIARAALMAGFSYNMLGMAMCSAAIDGGPEVSPAQLFAQAEARFTTAMEAGSSAGLTDVVNAARVGRARVRLYQGNTAGAAADAAQVPAGFEFFATASQDNNRRYNRVFASNVLSPNYTVAEESRNLMTAGVVDPRTASRAAGRNANDGTPLWVQQKYTDYSTPIRVASGAEARLILAEIQGGQTAVEVINSLRVKAGVPTFSSTDPAAVRQAVIEERRRELWLQGFRHYDVTRFDLPQVPAVGAPFPKGGVYGNTTCLPLPDVERFNNPNIGG